MSCMCGDTSCPSCGPAQGFNPEQVAVVEWLAGIVELPEVLEPFVVVDLIVDAIGEHAPEYVIDALVRAAKGKK